jgi:hypothetical protein
MFWTALDVSGVLILLAVGRKCVFGTDSHWFNGAKRRDGDLSHNLRVLFPSSNVNGDKRRWSIGSMYLSDCRHILQVPRGRQFQ